MLLVHNFLYSLNKEFSLIKRSFVNFLYPPFCPICESELNRYEHFICEDCCDNHSEDDLTRWTKTTMHDPDNGMPIALWLLHEQNKDKTMMSIKK